MFVRVVRFTGVDADAMASMNDRIEQSGGPPEGVTTTGLTVLHDADQGTAVVLQYFATAEDLASSEAVFEAMSASDTPGTRVSVDRCEVAVELTA